jgi:hypothetical protein
MGSWIALIASAVIGAMVLLSFQQFTSDASRDMYVDTLEDLAHNNLDVVKQLIEYDFMRIGLRVNDAQTAIVTKADSTELIYVMDSDNNGTTETMRYFLSTSAAAATKNPNDKFLQRQIDAGTAETIASGLTKFRIQYYDLDGNAIVSTLPADLARIRTFVVSLTMESDYGADADYPKLFWQGRFAPPSLVTR